MDIVIDSNIIFSILLKADGRTAALFFKLAQSHNLYISDFSFEELNKHQSRLLKISKLSSVEFEKLKFSIFSHFSIITSALFSEEIITRAYEMIKAIDIDDLPFVGAALFIDGILWTGDKTLYTGLLKKGFEKVYNSKQIELLINT